MNISLHLERRQARQDRDERINHRPAVGKQMAFALVDAMLRSQNNGAVEQRIAECVRTMH